jgi:hypothetical protein
MKYFIETKFLAERRLWNDDIAISGIQRSNTETFRLLPVPMELHTRGERIEPFMSLQLEQAQSLIDALYDAGLRPSQAAGSSGQLEAVKYHLEDMRKLALKL